METIKVLLVDDQGSVRRGLKMRLGLEADLSIVGEAPDGVTALEAASTLRPDVVVMDVEMPGMGGIEAAAALRQRRAGPQVVMLSIHDRAAVRHEAAAAGAFAFIAKHEPTDALLRAIRAAAQRAAGAADALPDDIPKGGADADEA